mmetsp:Transcript_22443/g.66548  ORF Transcript_22443/g.66548 Transcript_22443/m.66548 type:complete len:130 (+) Transcript_22443:3761-4150(+)
MARRCSKSRRWMTSAEKRLKLFKKSAKHATANCQQKILLIEAELFACRKQRENASKLFEDAIAKAEEHKFICDEAMAHERAWLFFESIGDSFKASRHHVRAYNCFLEWGAEAKAQELYKERARMEGSSM